MSTLELDKIYIPYSVTGHVLSQSWRLRFKGSECNITIPGKGYSLPQKVVTGNYRAVITDG